MLLISELLGLLLFTGQHTGQRSANAICIPGKTGYKLCALNVTKGNETMETKAK